MNTIVSENNKLRLSRSNIVPFLISLCFMYSGSAHSNDVVVEIQNELGNAYLADDHVITNDIINTAWSAARGKVCDLLTSQLGKSDLIASGVTLYDFNCNMSNSGTLAVSIDNNRQITLNYTLKNNYLEATSTTPTLFGNYADPRFSVNYDLNATITVSVPLAVQPLGVQTTVSISNANLDSHNFTGDLLLIANSISNFLGGPNFKAQAQAAIDSITFDFNIDDDLGSVDNLLRGLENIYMGLDSQILPDYLVGGSDDNVMLYLTVNTPQPPQTPPQNCQLIAVEYAYGPPAALGIGVQASCDPYYDTIDYKIVLERFDNNTWHGVAGITDSPNNALGGSSPPGAMYDFPGDSRKSASYRVCAQNPSGEKCTNPTQVLFQNPALLSGPGGGGGGGAPAGGFGNSAAPPSQGWPHPIVHM